MKAGDFRRRSFIEVLQRRMGIRLSRMEQRVEATVADMDVSAILGVEFGAPLFFVENQYFAGEAPPVEVTHMYYRGDRYVYQTTIRLEEGGDSRRREGAAR
jgi:GntR family transcriptional regulator